MERFDNQASPSIGHAASAVAFHESSLLQEAEHFELSTTVDPSYIIYLIRQLLPSSTLRASGRICSQTKVVDNHVEKGNSLNSERTEQQGIECITDTDASFDYIKIKNGCLDVSKTDEPLGESVERSDADYGKIALSEKPSQKHEKRVEGALKEFTSFFIHKGFEGSSTLMTPSSEHTLDRVEPLQQKFAHGSAAVPVVDNLPITEEQREEAGCVLWDLAANHSHAGFMVENHLLDVLLAVLSISHSDRMREICLGIMGNIACHVEPGRIMVRTQGLLQKVVQNLFIDDSPSLCEVCRLLSAGLHGEEAHNWVRAIKSEEVLEQIIWVAANTMHPQLLEKSTELLLAMVDGQRDATSALLPPLMRLGLQELLTDLLACEITALIEGKSSHGDSVLDILLQIAEALSLADDYASQLAANRNLFSLACQVIQLSGKEDVGPAGITATVLIANLLAEEEGLICDIVQDVTFTKQLVELLPCTRDDPGARNALWSILDRICSRHVLAPVEGLQSRSEMLLVLANGSGLLAEDLEDHKDDDMGVFDDTPSASHSANESSSLKAKLETVGKILHLLENWAVSHGQYVDRDLDRIVQSALGILKRYLIENDSPVTRSQHGSTLTPQENDIH